MLAAAWRCLCPERSTTPSLSCVSFQGGRRLDTRVITVSIMRDVSSAAARWPRSCRSSSWCYGHSGRSAEHRPAHHAVFRNWQLDVLVMAWLAFCFLTWTCIPRCRKTQHPEYRRVDQYRASTCSNGFRIVLTIPRVLLVLRWRSTIVCSGRCSALAINSAQQV